MARLLRSTGHVTVIKAYVVNAAVAASPVNLPLMKAGK